MVIEISLTRKLSEKLGLKLEPTENVYPSENHYYADIITKDRQQNILFFNTLFSWVCVSRIKNFKKDKLNEFKASVYKTLILENIKPYIAQSYLDEITDIKLSLTNNSSVTARLSTAKKDIHFFYERYYDVPDVIELSRLELFNDTLYKNPLSNKDNTYISPYEEMGYYLHNKYLNQRKEKEDMNVYFQYKNEVIDKIPKVMDFSLMSDEEINNYSKGVNKDHYYYTSSHLIRQFYKEHPHPTLEDHFEFIISHLSLKDIRNDHYQCYLRFFNLNERLFLIYYECFGRKYKSGL